MYGAYVGGHRNVRGLTGRGAEFVQRLIQHGMLIDLSHMSDATLANTYDVTDGSLLPEYPLMLSHAHFRPLALKVDYSDQASKFVTDTGNEVRDDMMAGKPSMGACIRNHQLCNRDVLAKAESLAQTLLQAGQGTTIRENLPREYDVASSEVQEVRARRGVIGVFLGQGALDASAMKPGSTLPAGVGSLPLALDCAGSSQGLAAALLFARARTDGRAGIGFLALGLHVHGERGAALRPRRLRGRLPGRGRYLGVRRPAHRGAARSGPVPLRRPEGRGQLLLPRGAKTCVDGVATMAGVPCGSNAALEPDVLGDRVYDFNVDGFAQYGLVPDMLQDVANQVHGARHAVLDPLFDSAEAYVQMWSTARSMSRCEETGLCAPATFADDPQCRGMASPEPPGVRRQLGAPAAGTAALPCNRSGRCGRPASRARASPCPSWTPRAAARRGSSTSSAAPTSPTPAT